MGINSGTLSWVKNLLVEKHCIGKIEPDGR